MLVGTERGVVELWRGDECATVTGTIAVAESAGVTAGRQGLDVEARDKSKGGGGGVDVAVGGDRRSIPTVGIGNGSRAVSRQVIISSQN